MIRVFIIDDALLIRNKLKKALRSDDEIHVIGEANNPVDALTFFKKVGLPDVFVLDIEMPKMNGLDFLQKINEQRPTPVIICSSLIENHSKLAIDALRMGAFDLFPKSYFQEENYEKRLVEMIKEAAGVTIRAKKISDAISPMKNFSMIPSAKVIAIGASTGGVQVLEEIVNNLRPNHPGIVITQHMPKGFTASFAKRLDTITASKVIEAQDDEIITNGKIIIAKGGLHMEVLKDEEGYKVSTPDFEKVNSHKPSINVLFRSMAKNVGKRSLGIILTGMGDDGASGLLELKHTGAKTYAQNRQTSAVYGMPRVAFEKGAVLETLSIKEISGKINAF